MTYNSTTAAQYDSYLASHNLTRQDLVRDTNTNSDVIDTTVVGLLSSRSTDLVDSIVGRDVRNTALTFLSAFN